jgi:hypothetical protein
LYLPKIKRKLRGQPWRKKVPQASGPAGIIIAVEWMILGIASFQSFF